MTKTELISRVAEKTGLAKTSVRAVLEAIVNSKPGNGVVATELKKGGKVTISGFGTFFLRVRKARQARNPKTGATVKVAKRSYPAFKPSKSLKEALKK